MCPSMCVVVAAPSEKDVNMQRKHLIIDGHLIQFTKVRNSRYVSPYRVELCSVMTADLGVVGVLRHPFPKWTGLWNDKYETRWEAAQALLRDHLARHPEIKVEEFPCPCLPCPR